MAHCGTEPTGTVVHNNPSTVEKVAQSSTSWRLISGASTRHSTPANRQLILAGTPPNRVISKASAPLTSKTQALLIATVQVTTLTSTQRSRSMCALIIMSMIIAGSAIQRQSRKETIKSFSTVTVGTTLTA